VKKHGLIEVVFLVFLTGCVFDAQRIIGIDSDWQEEFEIEECTLVTTGNNPFFILEPGFTIILESNTEKVVIAVLDETMVVDGVETRLIEEREWRHGELIEVSINMFAMCEETQDVFYFGEFVDMYSKGELVSHQGAWIAGENDARAGMIMPGNPEQGMRYYQEIAPGIAMDRAEIISQNKTLSTPAGTFTDCIETVEGTALNLAEREIKIYAPGIGLIQDANLFLTDFGYLENN
jgi:hypothetical protein